MRVIRLMPATMVSVVALLLSACGGGGGGNNFSDRSDTTPDAFAFTDQSDVALSTPVTSNAVVITGIDAPAAISISGGEYSIGCTSAFTATGGSISAQQRVCVRHTSAAAPEVATQTTLTVGGVGAVFTSTTAATPEIALARAFPALRFARPLAMEQPPGDESRWYIAEQGGIVRVFANDDDAPSSAVVIDLSAEVGDSGGERGLLGIAFDPAFASNGFIYLCFTRSATSLTSYVSRFTSTDGGQTLDPASEVVLLTLPQPYPNHNGGQLAFGPDGFLYVSFGDGGAANDPQNRAQDTSNLWGKILRIDVSKAPYTIPADNPFAGNARCDAGTGAAACPEIFAWGLRNPWRFSFDRVTGALFAGDVGQGAWEEVNLIESGSNYGWRIREGAHCNIPATDCPTAGLTDPVAEYGRSLGQSVTGGYVYRGNAINGLAGSYVFGDFSSGRVFRLANGSPPLEVLLDSNLLIASFAQDATGELLALSYGEGAVYRIVEAGE